MYFSDGTSCTIILFFFAFKVMLWSGSCPPVFYGVFSLTRNMRETSYILSLGQLNQSFTIAWLALLLLLLMMLCSTAYY